MTIRPFFACAVLLAAAGPAAAGEGFFARSLNALDYVGDAPSATEIDQIHMEGNRTGRNSVSVDGGAEAVLFHANRFRRVNDAAVWNTFDSLSLAVRGESGQVVQGALVVSTPANADRDAPKQVKTYRFKVRLGDEGSQRDAFWSVWHSHYSDLLGRDVPGAAWYRRQVRRADTALGRSGTDISRRRRFFGNRNSQAESTFALMSGGRALSENLQLDREMPAVTGGTATVALSTVRGITVKEFDWSELNKGLDPQHDPLAGLIPRDQHAVFLPSFQALVALADHASEHGGALLRMAEPRSEDAMSRQRYERQLGLSLDTAARLLGPQLINSVAITGGDAYLRTGTDIALLFESDSPEALRQLLATRIQLAAKGFGDQAASVRGEVAGVAFSGFRSPTRGMCSYLAQVGEAIVVTNSLTQLERLAETSRVSGRSLAETPEYTFFRNRYPRDNSLETALIVLSDDTIRRWCGPKWRIAASRRTRVAAVMSELQADHLADMLQGDFQRRSIESKFAIARGEQFVLSSGGIESDAYGDLDFQTPIMELDMTSVTPEEARLYRRWRDGYERNWSNYFDPIAVYISLDKKRVSADVTVMPLIDNTRYSRWMQISKGSQLTGALGDPHPEALMHWAIALNPDSALLKSYTNMAKAFAPQIRVDPLSWIGNGAAIYIDRDPLLIKAAQADDPEDFLEDHFHEMPIAFHVDGRDTLKLTLFLAGMRAFIEQTSPGLTTWEALDSEGEPYVKISSTDRAGLPEQYNIYYAAGGEGLTLSLSEDVIKRTVARRKARRVAAKKGEPAPIDPAQAKHWDGANLAMKVSKEGAVLCQEFFGSSYRSEMQRLSWANLTILNEWKRIHPAADPVALHEQYWHRRLLCPGGGEYVWNDKLQTMESTAYGCPQLPKKGPALPATLKQFEQGDFGVVFEDNGLRARMTLQKK